MLKDPIIVGATLVADQHLQFGENSSLALIDQSELGRTVRVGTILVGADLLETKMTIASSETKESKPFGTKRTSIRDEIKILDADGRSATGFVQVIIGLPKAVVTPAHIRAVRIRLLSLLLLGEPDGDGYGKPEYGDALVARILAGEG